MIVKARLSHEHPRTLITLEKGIGMFIPSVLREQFVRWEHFSAVTAGKLWILSSVSSNMDQISLFAMEFYGKIKLETEMLQHIIVFR